MIAAATVGKHDRETGSVNLIVQTNAIYRSIGHEYSNNAKQNEKTH